MDALVFEATPQNIAAYLLQNRNDPQVLICTLDYRMFLTTRKGLVDVCPDQQYLREQILPILVPMKMGKMKPAELVTLPREKVDDYKCPMPDWNYLRWEGYSDKRYEAIRRGDILLNFTKDGENHRLELRVSVYLAGGNLGIRLVCWDDGKPVPWDDLTVNMTGKREKNTAFVDTHTYGHEIIPWLLENELMVRTGNFVCIDEDVYPECLFQARQLKRLDAEGYRIYEDARKPRHSERPETGPCR